MDVASPTARALLALELIQSSPGTTAERLGRRLGVSERAARRYVGILREAGLPIDSTTGPYGGYRVGRGARLPPLMFTAPEALGLVMAVLEGHAGATDPTDPVESALGKIIRALPESVAKPAEAIRRVSARGPDPEAASPDPETTLELVQACASHRRVRLAYRLPRREAAMEVDPWAVVVRYRWWYLLCWSHTSRAKRVLRLDRVVRVEALDDTFDPPADLDPVEAVEEHMAEGWGYDVEVLIDAPIEALSRCIPRSLGRLEAVDGARTRLVASTDNPYWYAEQLAAVPAPFHILKPEALRQTSHALARRLLAAADLDA